MSWISNLVSLQNEGYLGNCPHCGSTQVKSNFKRINNDMGYGDIWCEKCKKAFHISRVKIDDELLKKNTGKPKELNY